jgi:DNA-binding transcriptional ArsR family regulator
MEFFDYWEQQEELDRLKVQRAPWWRRVLVEHPELREAPPEAIRQLREDHAISEEVWLGRPYVPYAAADWEAVVAADSQYGRFEDARRRRELKKVAQRPGLVMSRHGLKRDLPAQLRPFKFSELGFDTVAAYGAQDLGVHTRSVRHDHTLVVEHMHTPTGHRFVVEARKKSVVEPNSEWEELFGGYQPDGFDLEHHIQNQHGGKFVEEWMPHQLRLSWKRHLQKEHRGKPRVGDHRHSAFAKYLYPEGEGARGFDVHPLAWTLLKKGGDVVYVALEGCLKNDSILSTGAAVVSCGSVTLWKDLELPWLADEHLSRFKTVVLVPDSDWLENSLVRRGVCDAQDFFRGYHDNVVVAAPPQRPCLDCTHSARFADTGEQLPPAEHKLGVDDWLKEGHGLMSMIVSQVSTESLANRRRDSQSRDVALLDVIARRQEVTATYGQLADWAGLSPRQVEQSLKSLKAAGLITLTKSNATLRYNMHPYTVRLASPPDVHSRTLGDYLATRS